MLCRATQDGWVMMENSDQKRFTGEGKAKPLQLYYLENPMNSMKVYSSVSQLCQAFCDHMDCFTPGFSIHHKPQELAQTHVDRVGDDIQPSHPQLSPSPPAFNLSEHQGLFQWVSSLHQVARVLEFQLSASVLSMNIQDWFPIGWSGWISLQSKGLSRVFSNTTVQKHQFVCAQLSL